MNVHIVVDSQNTKYDSRDNCNAIIEKSTNTLIIGCKNTIIPHGVIKIGSDAFSNCVGLTSIQIPNGVTEIGSEAFYGCSNLTSVSIPESVTCIGESAFDSCSKLRSIIIPNSITEISDRTFNDCVSMTSAIIGDRINSIGDDAFSGTALTSVVIPNSVTILGRSVFYDCNDLVSVTIGNNVLQIRDQLFDHCTNLTSILIPESVKNLGSWAFHDCPNLTTIVITSKTPPKISDSSAIGTFAGLDLSKCTLYVPEKSITKYKTAKGWKKFAKIFKIFEWTKKDEEILLRMFKNNFSYRDISKALGCRKQEVLNHLDQLGFLSYNPNTGKYKKIQNS